MGLTEKQRLDQRARGKNPNHPEGQANAKNHQKQMAEQARRPPAIAAGPSPPRSAHIKQQRLGQRAQGKNPNLPEGQANEKNHQKQMGEQAPRPPAVTAG